MKTELDKMIESATAAIERLDNKLAAMEDRAHAMTTKNKAAQSLRAIPSAARDEASRINGAKGGRPAFGIQSGDDITIYKFPSAAARDAWVAEWTDCRGKIGSKDFTYRWHGLKTNYICTLNDDGSQCFYRDLTA